MREHPALHIDLLMSDDRQDLIAEGADVAFLFGLLPDSNATARMIGRSVPLLVASPGYLARAGTPAEPDDLAAHTFIIRPAAAGTTGWTFEKDGRRVVFRSQGRFSVSVNEGATAAAVAGLGILMAGSLGCRAELSDGRLVPVLPDWKFEPVVVNAVFPAGRAARPAARALVAFLMEELKSIAT